MIRAIIAIMAVLSVGCGLLQETPEKAVLRAERERQAALPLARASCEELLSSPLGMYQVLRES